MDRQEFPEKNLYDMIRPLLTPTVILLLLWGMAILIINPVGEFMVNDDWSFLKTLETLKKEGRMVDTGWGPIGHPGGPSLIPHLIWGLVFTKIWGFSLTTLRISVLIMGIVGSFGLLMLLRVSGVSPRLSLWATLALIFNPLFLSQCFTFMTDITFVSLAIFSILFLHLGVQRSRLLLIVVGLLLALVAILTRQIGIVIPIGFVTACFVHPKGRELGRPKMLFLAVSITVIPWLGYEFFLYLIGSTPITKHQVVHKILAYPLTKGFPGYLGFLCSHLFIAMCYACFLVSPVLALRYGQYLRSNIFRYFLGALTAAFIILEVAILAGLVDPPVVFYRNVIFDFGIGPILLKDTYIMGIERTATISTPLFYLLVYWAVLTVVVVIVLGISSLRRLLKSDSKIESTPMSFIASFSLIASLIYLGIILLTGFHDRYLIPVCILFIVWLVSDMPPAEDSLLSLWKFTPALVPLLFLSVVSVLGLSDFMDMKRSLHNAHNYLVNDLETTPCQVDGGFEFNGYHCYQKDFKPIEGLSWWWVAREDYLVTLGPLRGYRIIKTFPFDRYIGPNGAIHILQPTGKTFKSLKAARRAT